MTSVHHASRAEIWALFAAHALGSVDPGGEFDDWALVRAERAADGMLTRFDRRFKATDGGAWYEVGKGNGEETRS